MQEKRWVFARVDEVSRARLAHDLNVSRLTAGLLVNRGVRDAAEARRFLHPDLSELIDPNRFNDMTRAI